MTTVPFQEASPLGAEAQAKYTSNKSAAVESTEISVKQAADTPLEGSAKRIKLNRGPLSPKAHDTEMTEPESEDDSLFGDEEEHEDFRHQLAEREEKPQTLSEAELVERRLKHIQDLYRMYKVEYWGLLEELRTRHKLASEKQQLKSSWRLPSEAENGVGKDVTAETSLRRHFRQTKKRKASKEAEYKLAGPAASEQFPQEGKGFVTADQPTALDPSALASVPMGEPIAQETASAPDSIQEPPAVASLPPQQAGAAQNVRRNSGGSQSASPPGAYVPLVVHNPFSPFTTAPPGNRSNAAEDPVGALGDDIRGYGSEEDPATFSDAEAAVLSGEAGPGAASKKTLQAWRTGFRRNMQTLTQLEQAASGCTARELDRAGAMAVLCGRHNRFLIKRSAVSLGRTTDAAGQVDIDLTSEGDARKVSRQQAHLSLRADGRFQLRNIGRRTLFVNNRQVDQGQVAQLRHLSLIEVGGVRLLFMVNHASLRRASTRSAGLAMYCDPAGAMR